MFIGSYIFLWNVIVLMFVFDVKMLCVCMMICIDDELYCEVKVKVVCFGCIVVVVFEDVVWCGFNLFKL